VQAFDKYCQAFNIWQEDNRLNANDNTLANNSQSSETTEEIKKLLRLNKKVLDRAEKLFKQTAGQLQGFQLKAKGIMAYVDTLPKKISVTKHRKG
jgi:hypothetical protein